MHYWSIHGLSSENNLKIQFSCSVYLYNFCIALHGFLPSELILRKVKTVTSYLEIIKMSHTSILLDFSSLYFHEVFSPVKKSEFQKKFC